MRGVTLLGLVFGFGMSLTHAQDKQSYIRQYLDISISEMQRTGIPASIKLAQAILESNYGRSELAREAHNHFGIKCGRDWNGQGYGLKDDDRDQHGELVHSCFRVFSNDEESFIAHSDFLADPAKAKRYGALFILPPNDYKGWAQGLQKSGYATNQEYAKRLIQIIEEQELYRYDIANVDDAVAVHRRNTDDRASKYDQTIAAGAAGRSAFMIQFQNDIPYVVAQQGDDVKSIAKRTDVPAGRILRYNEITDGRRARLEAGDRLYLQPLKRKYHGNPETHVVTPGETIASIAHFYGVRSDVLRKRNRMSDDCEPAPGSRIVLRGKQKSQIRCASEREYLVKATPQVAHQPVPESHVSDKSTSVVKDSSEMPIEAAAMQMPAFMTPQMTYTVQPKDTLYQIATRHGITVVELKKLNNLSADTIHPGQSLKIQN